MNVPILSIVSVSFGFIIIDCEYELSGFSTFTRALPNLSVSRLANLIPESSEIVEIPYSSPNFLPAEAICSFAASKIFEISLAFSFPVAFESVSISIDSFNPKVDD